MMFLLRCAFWLSIVYGAMFWHAGGMRDLLVAGGEVRQAAVQRVTQAAMATVSARCQPDPRQCIADAARLTAIIDAGKSDSSFEASAARAVPPEPAVDVPVPVRRPRGVMLTRAP